MTSKNLRSALAVRFALATALTLPVALGTLGCQKAYFATMEQFGVHKREILVDRVEEARDAQGAAKDSFVDALTAFRALQDFDGGSLEALHKDLAGRYENCRTRVMDVRDRIEGIEAVSQALFEEWQGEIGAIQDAGLRAGSEQQLAATKARYGELIDAMRRAEARMAPVLAAFNDRVLFLKHNLNAQAIASLKGSLSEVQTDVSTLIVEMEASIAEADAFVAGMQSAP